VLLTMSFVHAALAAIALLIGLRTRAAVIAAVVVLDLTIAGMHVNDYAPRSLFDEPPTAAKARELAGPGRLYSARRQVVLSAPDDDLLWLAQWSMKTLDKYSGATFGIPVVYHDDYDGLAPQRMANLSRLMPRLPWPQRKALLDRAAVRVFITDDDVRLPGVQEVGRLATPRRPLRLYANPTAAPARFVSAVDRVASEREALMKIVAGGDLSRVVLAAPHPPPGNCGNAPVRITARTLSRARYEVDAPCSGWVVLAENHYDGWSATVDGARAPLVRADYAFTAVAVPAGRHTIARRYVPPRLFAGLAGTVITALLLLLAARRLRVTS
jgi:hypothetical protein